MRKIVDFFSTELVAKKAAGKQMTCVEHKENTDLKACVVSVGKRLFN